MSDYQSIEVFAKARPPYVICPVEDPMKVEDAVSKHGLTVGDSWWASSAEQKQPDGRWLLYLSDAKTYKTLVVEKTRQFRTSTYGYRSRVA